MTENKKIIFREGEHFAEPLVIETGSMSRHIVLETGAKLNATAFILAVDGAQALSQNAPGPKAQLSLTVDLAGEGAEFHLHALWLASGSGESAGRADVDVRVNHLAPGCTSRQLIKGIATDMATGSFTGMVHVASGAQRTDSTQRSQNMQLTDTAHVFTRPQLEIYADDVKCSHGATVGRLDEEAVYYMRQRGVSEAEARRMQMQGFAGEIINHCSSDTLRESLADRICGLIDRF